MEIDAEVFINLVKQNPVLWDSRLPGYPNVLQRRETWPEIAKQLCPKFHSSTKSKQDHYVSQLRQKWQNIKKKFVACKKQQFQTETTAKFRSFEKFITQLNFLEPLMNDRMELTRETLFSDEKPVVEQLISSPNPITQQQNDPNHIINPLMSDDGLAQHLSADPLDEELISVIPPSQGGRRWKNHPYSRPRRSQKYDHLHAFGIYVYKELKNLPQSGIHSLQISIMQAIQDYSEKHANTNPDSKNCHYSDDSEESEAGHFSFS